MCVCVCVCVCVCRCVCVFFSTLLTLYSNKCGSKHVNVYS